MDASDIYNYAYQAAKAFFALNTNETTYTDSQRMHDEFFKNPAKYTGKEYETFAPVMTNLARLMVIGLDGMDSKVTTVSTIAALKRMIPKERHNFNGIFEDDGRYCICDGYRMVRLKSDLSSFPHVCNDFDTKRYVTPFEYDRVEIELPTIAELKAHLKRYPKTKHSSTRPFVIDGAIPVDPSYLLDMLYALPGCKCYLPEKIDNPIYFESENGDGILLPIRINSIDNAEEVKTRFEDLRKAS